MPSTLTTDRWAAATTREPASRGSGAGTSRTRVGVRSPNTSGKPRVSTVSRSDSDSALACSGITPSIVLTSALFFTDEASQGSDELASGTATSQATSSTATSETTAPPMSSAT